MIRVTVEGDSPEDIKNKLAEMLASMAGETAPAPAPEPEKKAPVKKAAPKKAAPKKAAAKPKEEEKQEEMSTGEDEVEVDIGDGDDAGTERPPTPYEEAVVILAELYADPDIRDQVLEIRDKFNVKKFSDIPDVKGSELLNEARTLQKSLEG